MVVVSLGPGKFYGSSLPRPRIYTDVKYADERVDPPISVLDPLLSWANEAHWSMGGLSTTRLRLQGRIEGNVEKLRKELEKRSPISHKFGLINRSMNPSLSPPPAPAAVGGKRKRYVDTESGGEEEDEGVNVKDVSKGGAKRRNRRLVRKLRDDFDEVATLEDGELGGTAASRTRRGMNRNSKSAFEFESGSDSDSGMVLKEVKNERRNGKAGGRAEEKDAKEGGSYVSIVSVSPSSKRCSPRLLKKR